MDNFERVQPFIAEWEGGLSNDKYDAGGITKYGVSLAFLKDVYNESAGNREKLSGMGVVLPPSASSVKLLTREQATALFRWQFWDRLGCDRFPIRVAAVLYDAAVNCGRGTSVKLMQRGCNAAGYTPKLSVDCMLGPKSREAFIWADNEHALDCCITVRENYYKDIVRSKPTQSKFLKGWLNRAKALRTFIKGL